MRNAIMGLFVGIFWLLVGDPALADAHRGGNPGAVAAAPAAAKGAAATGGAPAAAGVVNLNEATPEQLEFLPGVGPSKAKAIVDHRKAHPFKRVEELTRIKGIGKKTFARLRPLLSLSGPTTLSERPARQARR